MKITYNNNLLHSSNENMIGNITIVTSPVSCGLKINNKSTNYYKDLSLSKNKHNHKVLLASLSNNTSINLVFTPEDILLNGIIELKGAPGSYIISFENGILKLIFKSRKDKIEHLTTLGLLENITIEDLDKILEELLPLIAKHIKDNRFIVYNDIIINITNIINYINQTLNIAHNIIPTHTIELGHIAQELAFKEETFKRNI